MRLDLLQDCICHVTYVAVIGLEFVNFECS